MNSKKIIIFDYDVLFNILDEIKENFNFDIINCNQKNLNTILDKLEKDFLIISRKKKENFKNNLIIKNNPLSINKLIEMININFLKIQFNFQSEISIGNYKLDLNSREIGKNNSILDLINFIEPVFSIFPLDVITLSILTNVDKIIVIPIKEQLEIRRY